jgi:hypothetical protein
MCRQRVLVHHLPIFLFSWQVHVTQQHNELLRFNWNSFYANAPQCYVVRTLPILFKFDFVLLSFLCVLVCCLCTLLLFLYSLCNSICGCFANALIIKNRDELLTYMSSNFVCIKFSCHTQNFYHRCVSNCWHINSVLYKILGSIYDLYPYELLHVWLQCFVIWHSEDRASWYILIMKANEMYFFSDLFDKVLYMFRTCPPSIIRSISTLYTRNRYLSF